MTNKLKLMVSVLLFMSYTTYGTTPIKLKSKIKKVTVYQQGAQIKRKANYTVKKGISTIYIQSISPYLDKNSIQINATGHIIILDSKYSIEYPTPEIDINVNNKIPLKILKEINILNDSIFEYGYKAQGLQFKLDVLNSEKAIIQNNGTIKGKGKVNDSIPLLADAITFYHKKMNAINIQLLDLTKKKALLSRIQNRMTQRLQILNSYNSNNNFSPPSNKEPIYKIAVTVSAKETTSGRIYISYLVRNAGWTPQYDLRSKGMNNTIDLTYKAQVYQNTGIDWNGVQLNLSTNNPYANKTKPELNPWYLYYSNNYYQTKQKEKSFRIESKKEALRPVTIQETYEESVSDSEDIEAMNASQFTQVIEQLINIEYQIDLPYTIASNNEKHMVLVDYKTLKTKYKYYAVPKVDLSSYLVAQISDLGSLNLIPGDATIFHDGAYLGKTYINPSTMSDTMNLSLGKDSKITIKRTLLKKDSKQKIIGDNIVKRYAFEIEIKNHKSKTTKITIQDQIPITQNSEIEIEIEDLSKGKLKKTTGLIEWDLKLKPKETKIIKFVYTVKYSRQKQINLAMLN